jgi:hypothetical protein
LESNSENQASSLLNAAKTKGDMISLASRMTLPSAKAPRTIHLLHVVYLSSRVDGFDIKINEDIVAAQKKLRRVEEKLEWSLVLAQIIKKCFCELREALQKWPFECVDLLNVLWNSAFFRAGEHKLDMSY